MGFLVSRDFRWHQLHFDLFEFLRFVGEPFLRPGLHSQSEPRGAAVNGRKHGATLGQEGVHRPDRSLWFPRFAESGLNEPRGARPFARETSRCTLVFGWPVLGPDREAIIRFGGKAPRGGPILTNGSMTVFWLRSPPPRIVIGQPGKGGFRRACRNSVCC